MSIGEQQSAIVDEEGGTRQVATILEYLVDIVGESGERTILFDACEIEVFAAGKRHVVIVLIEHHDHSRSFFLVEFFGRRRFI